MSAAKKLLHADDAYNQYVYKKLEQARRVSSFHEQSDPESQRKERENFVRIYNLKCSPDHSSVRRCVEIIHTKYKIDVTHGLDFIKQQWEKECGGSAEALARTTLMREYNLTSCALLVAQRNNAVNQVATCDDFRRYWTLTDLLRDTADPNHEISIERLQQALANNENMDEALNAAGPQSVVMQQAASKSRSLSGNASKDSDTEIGD